MKKIITLVIFVCFTFLSSAQVLNTKFPLGSYSGRLSNNSFPGNTFITYNIINEQDAFISVLFDIDFGFEQHEEPVPIEFITKYTLKNDTLFFEKHDDSVPYLVYYLPNNVAETGGIINVQTVTSKMFETYGLVVHPLKGKDLDLGINDIEAFLTEEIVHTNHHANTGDTLWVETSMGVYGFLIPGNVNKLCLIPNIPDLGFEYAYKGESANELILKTGLTMQDQSFVFYKRAVIEADLAKVKEKQEFTTNKIFIQACKSIRNPDNIYAYEDEYTYNNGGDNYLMRKDTIRYSFSYKDALKIAKEENLFIRVFYVEGNQCLNEYLKQIRALNQDYYYDNQYSKLMSFILVFLNEKDEKLVQRWGISIPNTDFILSPDEILLYQKKVTCRNEYDISFFSSGEEYLNEELQFMYLDQVITPQLIKNPKKIKALELYLNKINQMIQTIDYFSYYDSWTSYIDNREYYFKHIDPKKIPSAEILATYLDNYVKAKMNAPFDTTLAEMIVTFYNIVYRNETNICLSSSPVKYLVKHAKSFNYLHIDKSYKSKTLPEIILKSLTNLKSGYQDKYTQNEILQIYQEAIETFPEYTDYFYLLSYYALEISAVSPDLYADLLAFYKQYMQKVLNISDWRNYLQTVNDQISLFETEYGDIRVYNAGNLYKILPHLAWIIGIHEGKEGANIPLALQCAEIAGVQSAAYYYDYRYIIPNYVALLYLLGYKDKAIAVQKTYCADKADNYSDYAQEMMYMLKAMILDIYEPQVILK